jgi:hypothetical protein
MIASAVSAAKSPVPLLDRQITLPVVRSGVGAVRPPRVPSVLLAGDVVQVPAVAQLDPHARAVVLTVTDMRFTQWPGVVELSGIDRETGVAGQTLWVRSALLVPAQPVLKPTA